MKKLISLLVALCFCNLIITDIYSAIMPVNMTPIKNSIVPINNSLLPVDIGKIVQDVYVFGDRTVINIQDLHSDENTQRNIVSILNFLSDNYNVKNIYFEGAIGNLDFGWLNTIKDEKLKENVANKLLQDGKITGAEYFGIFNKKKGIAFKGLEEEKIYRENFALLKKIYGQRSAIQLKIKNIENTLTEINKKTYNYKLSFIDDLVNDYNNGNVSKDEYYLYLIKILKDDNVSNIEYSTITEFLNLKQLFDFVNMTRLEKEMLQINKEIKGSLSYEKYSEFQKEATSYPNRYYNDILKFIIENNSEKKYVEIIKFLNYLKQKNSIDIMSLLNEEDKLTNMLYDNNAKTVVEKNLVFLNLYTKKLLLFLTNNLPSFEYEYITNNFNKYCILLENYISNTDIIEIKQWYRTVDTFYSNNEKRNLYFLETLLDKKISKEDFINDFVIKNDERKSFEEILQLTKQPVDIMVTGGYHSQGLQDLMVKLNINYAVIMPSIRNTNIKGSEDKFYKDYLKQYSILSNTYQKFIRSSVMNTVWEDPVKVMVGTFFDYSLLNELFKDLKSPNEVTNILNLIQQHLVDISKAKNININFQITNMEQASDNSFIITISSEGKERLFYISNNIVGEIQNKEDISKIEKELEQLNTLQSNSETSRKRILKKISRFITMILVLPVLAIMGGGGISFSNNREKKQPQPKKSLTNNGAKINITDKEQVEFIDTVIDEGAQVDLEGKIKLDNVFIGKGNNLKLKAGQNTSITLKNIDMNYIGELDITIEDNGEYEIVSEDGIVKVYKVLRTDFSSSAKKRTELVSIIEKGKLFLPNESNWEKQNSSPVIVFYKDSYSAWGKEEEREKRSQALYKNSKVVYVDVSRFSSYDGSIYKERFIEFLKENGLSGKDVCLDFSLIEENKSKPFEQLTDVWTTETKSATFISTSIPVYLFDPSSSSVTRDNKHFYMNEDGTFKRYPYKDRNWLRRTLQKFLPSFEDKTFVFVWPVESVKYTYYIPQNSNIGGTPEQRVSAFEPFKQFMDKAREYSADGKASIVFMPGYLITELAAYLNNPNITNDFVDITYGNTKEMNSYYNVWYQTQNARDIEKIEVLKLGGLSIVMYPEGNRGHNEQAYLKTLMATYNFGKESFDGMLTQAGFTWKSKTVYVYEGQEMESLDMEAQLLKNPSIKTGKVSYVYENLKKVFIALYLNMNRFFKPIIPKFTKGNWISMEDVVRDAIDISEIKEFLLAKSKLGFDSIAAIPVNINVLNEKEYGQPVILEQDGKKIPVYTLKIDDFVVYLVGVENKNMLWQDSVLHYIKDYIREYKNNIISFNGVPQITSARVNALLTDSFLPVVLNSNAQINDQIQSLGYDDIVDVSDIVARIGNEQLKYPHVAGDMQEISEAITVIKQLKRKSFFGNYRGEKSSYVGVKIASDEHIFNNETEENEFIEILKGSDIDFVTVVIRDNDLGVHVLNRETTVKENLTKLSQNLHKANKKIVLEYTFRFIDEFFKSFARSIYEDCKDMSLDGIKLDLSDCSVEDIEKTIEDLKEIREELPKLSISIQVTDKAWTAYSDKFEDLNITRTVSSKEELLLAQHDLSSMQDVNYEISIYKNQQEYEQKVLSLSSQRERLLDKNPEKISDLLKPLVELGEEKFADQIIDTRLEQILQKVVLDDSIGTLILPVNMLYAQRLKNNENSNVIQAVSNLIRLFKEAKGMNERRLFAYKFGLQQQMKLTDEQEEEIAKILRGENKKLSAGNYVRKHFPYVFDYFVESRQTRIEISDSFLFGIYEANIIRKYKEGQFGTVLQFRIDNSVYKDTQEAVDTRQALFYRALAHVYLYKNIQNIQDMFSLTEDEYIFYEGKNSKEKYINDIIRELKRGYKIYNGTIYFKKGFPLLVKDEAGYLPNRQDTVYEARLIIKALLSVYDTQEIEPVLPEITEGDLHVEDTFINENINDGINSLLASA